MGIFKQVVDALTPRMRPGRLPSVTACPYCGVHLNQTKHRKHRALCAAQPGYVSSIGGKSFPPVAKNEARADTNLAQGKSADQSSTYAGLVTSAVDGNTDGVWADGTVTHTQLEPNAWWQVDLGESAHVNWIVIWNRTDCCGDRLGDYWVFLSEAPFARSDTPATLQSRTGTWASHQTVAPSPSTAIPVNGALGRYVRIQLSGTNYLSLAEVQVLGSLL